MKTVFSTEVVDLNNQAPNRNKRESKYYWDELYKLIAVAGFDCIEVPYEPKWDFGGRSGIPHSNRSITMKYGTVENYMKEIKKIGIEEISCIHLDPSLFCGDLMEMYLGAFAHYAEEALQFAAEAKTPVLTLTATACIYGTTKMMQGRDGGTDLLLEKTAEFIDAFAGKAAELDVKLCLKNEYWGLLRGERIIDFISSMKNNVFLDIDTAHLQIAGVDIISFIEKHADRIGIVHFTDTAFVDDQDAYLQALPEYPAKAATKVICDPGEGNIDFAAVQTALTKAGYDGDVVFNCKNSYDVYRSILRARSVANSLAF